MKKQLTAAALAIGIISFPVTATEEDPPPLRFAYIEPIVLDLPEPLPLPPLKEEKFLQYAEREEWLEDLVMCESQGNPNALNPVDLDGTPSHGILQFKESTFNEAARRYKISGGLYDPEAQREIVRRWMDNPAVIWENQFPNCVRKLGRPPGT